MQKDYSAYLKEKFPPKELFIKRMTELIGESEAKKFFEISYTPTPNYIRCNTLKITPNELLNRLKNYGWVVKQPFNNFPEIMVVEGNKPGELGNSREHLLGYYYVQEVSSMMPVIVLDPKPGEVILDLCASPGSKTTQMSAMMGNSGSIIANEVSMGRLSILNSNLERCGVMNTIVTRKEGTAFCEKILKKSKIRFDKILLDAPCSGEGTLRKSPKTFQMWNENMIKKIAKTQRSLINSAIKILKEGGEMVYSTCTLAPEEDEMIINSLIKNHNVKIEKINLPLKFREGIIVWEGEKLSDELKKCARIYPQDNNTDGFFLCKIKKLGENETTNI
ncbi:MAG: RsmB/NOP family class I SAM-dependent RNA methyltransferase [Candidatus Pacearchaeota archaeon]